MTSPGAGTATTGRQHNHPRRRHSHRRLHCRLWCRNNSPTSDARTSVSWNITINIHTTIPHGTDTATAGDILTYPRCRTTADTATGDFTSNTPVIHTSTMTHTLPSRHRYPLIPSITRTATAGDIHSFTHHRHRWHSHRRLQQHAATCTPAATSLTLLPLWLHPSTTDIAPLMRYLPFI